MLGSDRQLALSVRALLGLALGAFWLSRRFYTSAAFERPAYFSIVTLAISAIALRVKETWANPNCQRQPLELFAAPSTAPYRIEIKGPVGLVRRWVSSVRRLNAPFRILLACLIARTLLFWYVLHWTQCSSVGLEAFLPFLAPWADSLLNYATKRRPETELDDDTGSRTHSRPTVSSVGYNLVSASWAVAAIWALDSSLASTGVVCPVGWRLETWTPCLQMVMCVMDAVIVASLSRLRRWEVQEGRDSSRFLSVLFLVAAGCVAVISSIPILIDVEFIWVLRLNYVEVRDVVVDSCIATAVLLCSISLFEVLDMSTVVLVGTSLGLFGFHIPNLGFSALVPPLSVGEVVRASTLLTALTGVLIFLVMRSENASRSSTTALLHRYAKLGYLGILCLCGLSALIFPPTSVQMKVPAAVNKLFQVAQLDANRWAEKAASSKSLEDAVAEYRRRYNIPPPPNFDKWYEFATERNSPVIDSFDQIHKDVLPFWGVEPSEIRERTAHLLERPGLEMGGLRIRNGVLQQSPYIPGTHRWMAETVERMIEPFAEWLPDMDIAMNLADECRMAIPFEKSEQLMSQARQNRMQLLAKSKASHVQQLKKEFSKTSSWPEDWTEPDNKEGDSLAGASPYFTTNIRRQLYYEWVAPTCPRDAVARNSRWWDRGTTCFACIAPHSMLTDEGVVMAHAPMADDVCYQPDLAYLDGFISSPTLASTKTLLPIFSQSRIGGFSDILFPSPWNFDSKSGYEEADDMDWADKANAMFWRGTSSDGYSWHGTWTGFVRSRLVAEGYQQARTFLAADQPLGVNVSFSGEINKCHYSDCDAEREAFGLWGSVVTSPHYQASEQDGPLPPATAFEENWRYRHLIDMDGAGFSGRFLPFLQSRSLVYRAALFKSWFDERLLEWYHYVPVDVRLGPGFWSVLGYLASDERHDASKHSGDEIAQRIAQQGREWAEKALRVEDMQIYMFRLLLEWGRLVDDERESLGYMGE